MVSGGVERQRRQNSDGAPPDAGPNLFFICAGHGGVVKGREDGAGDSVPQPFENAEDLCLCGDAGGGIGGNVGGSPPGVMELASAVVRCHFRQVSERNHLDWSAGIVGNDESVTAG